MTDKRPELGRYCLERVTGIEPALSAWEADVLPLNYTRAVPSPLRATGPGFAPTSYRTGGLNRPVARTALIFFPLLVPAQLHPQRGAFLLELPDLRLQLEDAADAGQAHALVRELDHVLDHGDLTPRVTALLAFRPGRADDALLVEAPQECLLDLEHDRDLPDREQGQVLIVDRQRRHGSLLDCKHSRETVAGPVRLPPGPQSMTALRRRFPSGRRCGSPPYGAAPSPAAAAAG